MQDLLAELAVDPAVAAANALIAAMEPIVICTGFSVEGRPETDGPPGAIALLNALQTLDKRAILASWAEALDIFIAVVGELETIAVPVSSTSIQFEGRYSLVTIEACGKCFDGSYRNMRGIDVTAHSPRFEDLFGTESLLSFGDGGNEFGMGSAPKWLFEKSGICPPVSTTQFLVPATTSNYGVYAVLRELEKMSGKVLLPNVEDHISLIRRLVNAGCVDGITKKAEATVDGRNLEETIQLLTQLTGDRP